VSLHSTRSISTFFYGFIVDRSTTTEDLFSQRTSQDLAGNARILVISIIETSSRLACLQDLLEVGPARLLAAILRDLGVSTHRFDQDHDSVFFSSLIIKPAMPPASMLGDYSTRASSTPSWSLRRTDLLGNLFLIMSLLDLLLFLFSGSSYRPSCPPRCLDTTL
jgi:hypothetical protein